MIKYLCLFFLLSAVVACNGQANNMSEHSTLCEINKLRPTAAAYNLPQKRLKDVINSNVVAIIYDFIISAYNISKIKTWKMKLTEFNGGYYYYEMSIMDDYCNNKLCVCGFWKDKVFFSHITLAVDSFDNELRFKSENSTFSVYKRICNVDCKEGLSTACLVFFEKERKMQVYLDDGLTKW